MSNPAEFLSQLMGEGWQGLHNMDAKAEQANAQQQHKQYERAVAIARVFRGSEGVEALQLLQDATIHQESWKVDQLGLVNACGYGIFREGQNSIVRFIQQCIERAEAGPPEIPVPEETS